MANRARTAAGIGISLLMVPPLAMALLTPLNGSDVAAPAVAAPAAPATPIDPEPETTAAPTPATRATPTTRSTGKPDGPPQPPVPPPPPPAANKPPAGGPAAGTRPAGCSTKPIRPTRFQVPRMGVDVPMLSVGNDSAGNPGAPPKEQLFSSAWYRGSPSPGSSRGNVIVNVHSYASGAALGNNLNGSSGLRAGDVIKVVGEGGQVACYRFREKIKFSVASYDRNSGIYHNAKGRPQLAIMTCWDRNPRTGDYDSRIIFYADRVI